MAGALDEQFVDTFKLLGVFFDNQMYMKTTH